MRKIHFTKVLDENTLEPMLLVLMRDENNADSTLLRENYHRVYSKYRELDLSPESRIEIANELFSDSNQPLLTEEEIEYIRSK